MNTNLKVTIITPSFNEEGNIAQVIKRVSKALISIPHEIIVEDDSTDKTPQIVNQLKNKYPVRLFHRDKNKLGLAKAIVHGIKNAKGKYICIIDSDLQHPPEKIRDLFEKAEKTNADMVVASRYVPGGGSEGLKGPIRKLASLVTKYLAYILIDPARKTTDPTGGFFMFKRSAVKGIELKPIGFKISIEVLARGKINKVEDIPYVFKTRTADDSKFSKKLVFLYLKHLLVLFFSIPSFGRLIKFGIVGVSGVVVNLGLASLMVEVLNFAENISVATGIIVSTFTNFLLNNYFTWRDLKAKSAKEWARKVTLYFLGTGFGTGLNYAIYLGMKSLGLHYLIAESIGIIAATAFNFLFSKLIVWRDQKGNPQTK